MDDEIKKEALRKYKREWARAKYHSDLEAARRKVREYRLKHKDKTLADARAWKKAHPEQMKEYNRKYYDENKSTLNVKRNKRNWEKFGHATQRVEQALRTGRLVRQPCEVCGGEPTQAHHCDYNKPLDVMWLCRDHHAEWHRNNKPKYITEALEAVWK